MLWIFTAGVLFAALIILKRSLNAESKVIVNLKEMTIHFTAFALFLAACFGYLVVPIKGMSSHNQNLNLTSALNGIMIVIVVESVSGLILLRIFYKIYIVVKNRAEINDFDDLDDKDGSFVSRPSLNGSTVPKI